jgi:hypothetical protein
MVSGLNASDRVCLSQTHLLSKVPFLSPSSFVFRRWHSSAMFNAASTAKRTLSGRVGFVGNGAHLRIDTFGELQNIVGIGAAQVERLIENLNPHPRVVSLLSHNVSRLLTILRTVSVQAKHFFRLVTALEKY